MLLIADHSFREKPCHCNHCPPPLTKKNLSLQKVKDLRESTREFLVTYNVAHDATIASQELLQDEGEFSDDAQYCEKKAKEEESDIYSKGKAGPTITLLMSLEHLVT